MNKVIRNYHGHLSGVYCMKIHEGLGVLVSGGRDSTAMLESGILEFENKSMPLLVILIL